jgi:hypothetical protein
VSFEMVRSECRAAAREIERGQLSVSAFTSTLARMEAACDRLFGLDQRFARGEVALLKSSWEVAHDPAFHASGTVWAAQHVMDRAFRLNGTASQRLAQARALIEEMEELATTAPDQGDRPIIRRMMGPVIDLIAQVERELSGNSGSGHG